MWLMLCVLCNTSKGECLPNLGYGVGSGCGDGCSYAIGNGLKIVCVVLVGVDMDVVVKMKWIRILMWMGIELFMRL